jgi:hypothetical protein
VPKLPLKGFNNFFRPFFYRAFYDFAGIFIALGPHAINEAVPVFNGRCLDLITLIPLTNGSQNGNNTES